MDASDDDEVPPLEDMSELLAARGTENKDVNGANDGGDGLDNSIQNTDKALKNLNLTETQEEKQSEPSMRREKVASTGAKKEKTSFGGFKKGFLFSKPDKSQAQARAKPVAASTKELPIIRPRDPQAAAAKNQIKEVQDAMKAGAPLLENKDWITDDLLKKLESNPDLMKELEDPNFNSLLHQLTTNPALAEQTMEANPKLRTLVQNFCGLLGEHFITLGDKEAAKTSSQDKDTSSGLTEISSTTTYKKAQDDPLDEKAKAVLSNPDIIELLKDTWVQGLMTSLRSNPNEAQQILQKASPEQRYKIHKLVEAGLLAPA